VEEMAKKLKTEAIVVDEKGPPPVKLGTQATQAARDQHPPWPRKQTNKATENQPMGTSTYLWWGEVSLMETVKRKWRKRC
jgi:hypothetical protein